MDIQEIKMQCLRLAEKHAASPDELLEIAQGFYDFIIGDYTKPVFQPHKDFLWQNGNSMPPYYMNPQTRDSIISTPCSTSITESEKA